MMTAWKIFSISPVEQPMLQHLQNKMIPCKTVTVCMTSSTGSIAYLQTINVAFYISPLKLTTRQSCLLALAVTRLFLDSSQESVHSSAAHILLWDLDYEIIGPDSVSSLHLYQLIALGKLCPL